MAEGTGNPRGGEFDRNLQDSFEHDLMELRDLHATYAVELEGAYSPTINELLVQASDERYFTCPISVEQSSDDSSRTPDNTGTTPGEKPPSIPFKEGNPEEHKIKRKVLGFVCKEFMTVPRKERMRAFRGFLDQVKDGASRISNPGGASSSPDRTATLQQCIAAVKTMKEIIVSKFESVRQFTTRQMKEDEVVSSPDSGHFSGARQTGGISDQGPSGAADQSVIASNPQSNATGATGLGEARQPAFHSGLRTKQVSHSRSHDVSDVDQEDRSSLSRKRFREMKRQDAMDDEGFD